MAAPPVGLAASPGMDGLLPPELRVAYLLTLPNSLLTLSQFLPGLPADTLQGHRDRFMEQFTK